MEGLALRTAKKPGFVSGHDFSRAVKRLRKCRALAPGVCFPFAPKGTPGAPYPDFLWSFVGSLNFMRLSLKRGPHAVLSRAAYRKFGVSRSFFARCGIPRLFAPDFFAAETFPQPVEPESVARHKGFGIRFRLISEALQLEWL
jgi:hypothetical protein